MSKWTVFDGKKYYSYPGKDGEDWRESRKSITMEGLELQTLFLLIEDSFEIGERLVLERVH